MSGDGYKREKWVREGEMMLQFSRSHTIREATCGCVDDGEGKSGHRTKWLSQGMEQRSQGNTRRV